MSQQSLAQISFKTNLRLREKALKKAKQDGLTLKAFLTFAMQAYVDDQLDIGLRRKESPSLYLRNAIKQAEEELRKGDVISFDDSHCAIAYLDRFTKHKKKGKR